MTIRRILGPWVLVLLGGCASRAAVAPGPTAPAEDPVMQLRSDDAALRRRVQMLEDRVLYLEQRGAEPGGSAPGGQVAGQHVLPDGRALPVVRLAPQGGAAARPAPRPEPGPGSEPSDDDYAGAVLPEPEAAARSYRLEGSRLVELTTRNGPVRPDRPERDARGQRIIGQYEAAMAIYKSGQPERAESAFGEFAREFPGHDYADNALYWKGEAAYDQSHFADALASFTEVVERYGGGNKAPDALLKIGLCYRQLGDVPNARDVLAELIAAYPEERASDIARVKLAELES
ncbi:MAG: tol-pal system protein YbgF [Myxococcales bacterium]|nr:tol-pal system protein YbgF [Myxococcales bacterium]